MFPCIIGANVLNSSVRNIEKTMNRFHFHSFLVFLANYVNIFFSYFTFVMIYTKRFIISLLGYHIFNIIRLASNPKMIRIATERVIAKMANINSFRYFSFMFFIHNPMNSKIFSIDAEVSVTTFFHSLPFPAAIFGIFINKRIKEVFSINEMGGIYALSVTA